ncbi:MAG: hypothetical protein J6I79_10155 [Paludibacteraceae bacterium]|nr:hypothetical protein [Paludibacteraceae bacterium]
MSDPKVVTIEKISNLNNIYKISGKSSYTNYDVDLYIDEGSNKDTIKYVGSAVTDANGDYVIEISSKSLSPCFIATISTSLTKFTSEMSKNSCYELPLDIYVKKTGKGGGANWEDAMSEDNFYSVLPIVKDGTTFHIAAGTYEKKGNSSAYKINSNVTLIGGYPSDAQKGAVSDPVNNHTIFSTTSGTYGYTLQTAELFSISSGVSVEFHNLDFSRSAIRGNGTLHKFITDSCRFMLGCEDIRVDADTLIVRNSYFGKMSEGLKVGSGIYHIYSYGGYALVENSTFMGSTDKSLKSIYLSGLKKNSRIQNCTFINLLRSNSGYQISFEGDGPNYFVNNTIVGNGNEEGLCTNQNTLSFNNTTFIGNIFAGTDNENIEGTKTKVNAYNLVGFKSNGKNNKTITIDDVATIFEGSYADGVFTPTLAYNGGFTPTVKLIADRLTDNTSIRFPLTETMVNYDQRGELRMSNTCAGAYEMSVNDLDGVYVKKDGTGNGTSWNDAMGETAFFDALPKAKEGTTFYVAAGEYEKTVSSPIWLKNGIKVIGGYPANAKEGAVSDPVNNHTVLKPSTSNSDSKIMFSYYYNYDCGEGKQTAEFHNLDFLNTGLELKADNIVIDSCNFYECNNPVYIGCAQNLRISNSYFTKNQSKSSNSDYSIFIGSDPVAVIENCTFDEQPYTTAIKVDSYYDTASVRIVNNTFLLRDRANTEWEDEEGEHYFFYLGSKKVASLLHNTIAIVDASGYLNVSESVNKIGVKRADLYYNLFTIGDPKILTYVGGGDGGYSLYSNLFGKNNSNGNQDYNVSEELKNILDGTDDGVGFIPTLAYNGGYTPTIKLVKDKLSDGVPVRTSQNIVYRIATDQRGVSRKTTSTCYGAYEFECSKGVFAVNKSSIKVSKPYCYSQTGNGTVRLKIGNWLDGCKAYFYKGEEELWSVDALDSPNNNYNLKIADNAVEELYNGARYVDSVDFYYSGLSGGSYSFVLEDLCGNKTTTPITIDPIEKPSFAVSKSSKTELSCYNSTDGSIEITLVGGELELCGKVSSYDIKGLEFTEKNRTVKATGLAPGSYRFVYGTTAKMCSDYADTTIVITAPDTVKAKCDFKDAYCAEIGGSATFYANGGVGNYSVTISDISGNVFKKESFAGENTVAVGGMKLMTTYSAVVEDGNGCKAKELGGIRFWTKTIPELNTLLTPSNETCYDENNGRIKFTYSGNNDKDELVVSAIDSDGKPHNAYFSEVKGSALIEDLAPGEYTVKLDFGAEGCNTPGDYARTIGTVTIKPFEKILVDASSLVMTSPTCTNPANGRADIEIKNWPKGGMVTVYSNGNGMWGTQDDPTVGEYTGAAPGQFYYENEEKKKAHTAHVKIPNINGKTYTVEVKDKCGNVNDTYDFDFGELSKPMVLFREDNSHIELDCAGSTDGVIFFNVGGGSTPNLKAYVNDEEVMVGKGNCVKEGLPAGSYVIAYKSTIEGCKDAASETIEITEPTQIEIHKLSSAPVVCEAMGTTAYASVGGGTPDYTYRWTDAEGNLLGTGDKVEHLSVGEDYKLVVTDSKLCKDSATFNVELWNSGSLDGIVIEKVEHNDQKCYGVDNGSIKVQFSGNTSNDPLKLAAIGSNGETKFATTSEEAGLIEINDLAPATYNVVLSYNIEGCDVSTASLTVAEEITVEALEEPKFLEDNYAVMHNQCEGLAKGRMHLEMMGWKDGVYSWTLRRSYDQGELEVYHHCGEKLNGATTFDLWSLPEGKTIFTMWDACDTIYKKTENIKAAYVAPLEIEIGDCTPITCADRTDGSVTFVASHWDVQNTAHIILNGDTALKNFIPVVKADGKAYFELKGQGAGIFTLATKDVCKREKDSDPFDFSDFSAKNGMLTIKAAFNDAAEECEVGKRVIKASAMGGTAPYTFSIEKNGTAVETSEATEATSFNSKLLGEGVYSVSVTDNTNCKAINDEDLKINKLNVKLGGLAKKDQSCYGVNNAGVSVDYSEFDTQMAKLRLLVTEKTEAETKKTYEVFADASEGTLAYNELPAGAYEVKVQLLGFNGCEMSNGVLLEKEINFEALEEPRFLEENYFSEDNKCENIGKGRMHMEMMGWAPDVYTWTIKRAGQTDDELKKYTHCGDKLTNGATAFDLWTLPEGENVFTMWDACGYKYTKTADIKADYVAPLTIDTVNSKAYSCEGRTDGRFTFVAWPWDIEDSAAVLKDGNIGLKDFKPEVKDGKAYFELKGQGAGVYTLVTTDLCGREESKENNFTDFSTKNGMLTIKAVFDEDADECEIGKRVIKATATGGTAPYIFSIEKNGTAVETSEAINATSYGSKLLGEGKYTVSVTDKTDCKAVYGEDLTIKSEKLNVKLGTLANIEQTCYGKNNAGVSVSYSGFDTEVAKLRLLVTEKTEAETKKTYEAYADANEGTLAYTELPTGAYDVKVQLLGINGCEMNNGVLLEKEVEFKPLEEPRFLEDNYFSEDNKCENIGKGRMHLEMMGWAPDVYTWTIKRAGQTDAELKKHTHCGDKLPNGATAFDLWTLPEGENVFTMWDACGYKYTKTANIKADYVAPLTIDTVNSKAYSCEGRTDGRFTFVAWPWDIEDSAAVLKDGNIGLKDFKPEVKDGKAYFELKGQGAGVYTLVTTDLCGREESKENNFTDFSAKNGRLTVGVDFDAEAAKCDVEKRIFKVTATGGTAPYIYTITKGGVTVQTTETTENKSFNSQLLTDGTYVVTVTDKTDCKAVYDDGLTIKPSHTMKAKNRDVICGDTKQSLVFASIDNGSTLGTNYTAVDESGKEYLPLQDEWTQYGICTFELPTNVTLKGMIAKVDEQCSVYADLEAMPLDESALAEAKVTIDTLIHQRCYGIDDAELWVDYSGPKTNYDMKLRLKNVDKPDASVDTENKHGEKLQYKFENLAPGNYELYLVQAVGKCDAGLEPRKIQDISIKAIPHPFELIWDTVIQSTCYSKMNGNPAIEVHGWSEGNCTWELNKFNVDKGDYELEAKNTDAYPVSGDSAYWSSDHLDAGRYIISWTDYCHNTVLKKFEIDPLKEPSLKVLASSNTDLKCGYDKAYVDFHYEGGVPMNKRILIKYIPVGSSDEDWDFTTEELKAENTYRLYGFTPGSGNMGHKKAEGTDYVLTDEDSGLPDGKYHIFYEDATKKCQGDDVHATVEVQRPYVNLNLAKQDVLCFSENYGVINLVPTRSSKDVTIKYQFMDEFKQSKVERTEGQNFGEVIFKNPVEQKTVFQNRKNFLSYVFYDVESVSLEAKSMPQDELYKLMQDSIKKRGTNMRNPLSKFYKDGGYEYAVSDWIGFNMLPADMYYVTVNDIYGCQYKDSIEVKGPKDGLRVTKAIYPMGADPECNAEDRRIKFTCTGGYYPYYYNVVNLDEEVKDDYDVSGSGMASIDYVADSKTEKYIENGKQHIDYTSKMLKPGHYEVSVMDTMGCIAKWKHVIDVKAKHVLNAVPHVDVCDPASDNKLEILYPSNDAKSYALYIGHRTHCVYYPYCSVDDKNGGLQVNEGKSVHVHKCDESLYKDCDHFENCLEKRNAAASTISYKEKEGKSWISKTGFGLSGIPSGTIGVLVTMEDGCTAFDEYVYKSSGLPTSLAEAGTDPVKCNGDNTGALTFSLFGGNDRYTSIKLDGEDLAKTHPQLQMITTTAIPIKDEFGGESYDYITDKKNISVNKLLSDKSLFEDLRKYYDGEALYKEAVATLGKNAPFTEISKKVSELKHEYSLVNYAFRVDNLLGTVNWEDEQKNKKHILTVTDEQECVTSIEFDVYQPTKLKLEAGASVICPDGSGRIFAKSTTGGVPPYEYRMNEATASDFSAVFIPSTGKKPKTYEGVELQTPDAYEEYYVNEYHTGDHIPAGRGADHYMWVKDANGCEMKSVEPTTLSEIWAWDKVVQEQFISTWHNYGDVLVVVDPTDYSMVHEEAIYDSMKVIIVMDAEGEGKFEGIMQPKELYTYGVKECSYDGGGDCGVKKTLFGTYTTSWGIPEKAKEDYNEYLADDNKTLEPIHTYFDKLVSDDAQRRMTFVKFQTPAGKEVNLKDLIGNKTDYHLNFMVRVVAYVGGCDIVTEHNPLVLNLKGDEPFPDAHYKDIITVDAFPNPVAKDGKCTLKVTLSNEDNDFEYSVFSLDGRKLQNKRISSYSKHETVAKDDGNTDYIYEFEISGLTETSIVKVTTETNTAAVKILVK